MQWPRLLAYITGRVEKELLSDLLHQVRNFANLDELWPTYSANPTKSFSSGAYENKLIRKWKAFTYRAPEESKSKRSIPFRLMIPR
jgi:hypothetical protein